MLIINADDYGLNDATTKNTIECCQKGIITSVSAMMFMPYSALAAKFAVDNKLDVGLHLNFTRRFEELPDSSSLTLDQQRISSFLLKNKYSLLFYNPALKKCFQHVYKAQFDEYARLYEKAPTHFDGHHHMHLCTNMLIDKLISGGSKVRRNFSFCWPEKTVFNRVYRRFVDLLLTRRYICTDYFLSLFPINRPGHVQKIKELATSSTVEIEVHPGRQEEYEYLVSQEFQDMISSTAKGSYADI